MPPTRSTSSMSPGLRLASDNASRHGLRVRSTRSAVSSLNFSRVRPMFRCFGPLASADRNGRLISERGSIDSSHLAFSAASFNRCSASRSSFREIPSFFSNSCSSHSRIRWSKSSPPWKVSPEVALTSKTPCPSCRIETSKVPPPRS